MVNNFKSLFMRYWLPVFIVCITTGVIAAVLFGCKFPGIERNEHGGQTIPVLVDDSNNDFQSVTLSDDEDSRLNIQLSSGQKAVPTLEPTQVADSEPLSDEEIEQILERMPALPTPAKDQVDFKLPEDSLPPPRTGETIVESFPPDKDDSVPGTVESGPLEVLRYAPEGEIPLAPFINITFNQPMVPLATLDELTAEEVPVLLEPALPGTWRWVGTKTLNFQYNSSAIDRLPMATNYQVTIPSGTESAVGGVLAETVRWSFNTPPPEMTAKYPHQDLPQPVDPLFFAAFDQRIDPRAVLSSIHVTAEDQNISLLLASSADIEEHEVVRNLVESAGESRWLVFRAKEDLPKDTTISVAIGPGTPSAEGPLVTEQAQFFSFRTYAPLRIEDHDCSWWSDQCPPLTPFFIEFNNPIDVDSYNDGMLRIQPEMPGATVNIVGDRINIRGVTEGRTNYRVIVSGDIKDVFDQKLGEDTTLTFRVGSAEPYLTGPDEFFVTLDPSAERKIFSVYSINYNSLHVRIYTVEPPDWPDFKLYLRDHQQNIPNKPPGRLMLDETIALDSPDDVLSATDIDLSQVMKGKFGHFVVIVEPPAYLRLLDRDRYRHSVQAWIQVTQIGLDAFVDHSQMVVWTTNLLDGAPLAGVTVETQPTNVRTVTGPDGTVRIDLPDKGISYVAARKGEDLSMLPRSISYWNDGTWSRRSVDDELRWFVFDDRYMYKPGEEVHVKGWLRRLGGNQYGDVGQVGSAVQSVNYQVIGPQGNELSSGQSEVNALGGFDFDFTLPENVNLGYAEISLDAQGNLGGLNGIGYSHGFQIQEFRRPEFEVKARNETTGPYFVREHAVVAVEAKYYTGAPLPNAEVTWQVTSSPSNYSPPNWPDFVFGIWQPWWYYEPVYIEAEYSPFGPESGDVEVETYTGLTDETGNHYLRLDFDETDPPRPFSVLAESTVLDVNRQAWASITSLLVHPADLYVGLRSERTFVERGEPMEIDLIVTDLDGNPISKRSVEVKAARLDWKYSGDDWLQEEVDIQVCEIESTQDPVTCTFETTLGGRYQITAVVTDKIGRQNQSQFIRWVSGGQRLPSREVEQETVTLIPDKENYQPGETAIILVQAPFYPAEGLLTVSRSGMLYTERFQLDQDSTTLQVPIEDKHTPNLHIQVDIVGAAERLDDEGNFIPQVPPRPAYAIGQLNLNIPPLHRTLSLEIEPDETELEPGGETSIELVLTDHNDKPVGGAELAVVVVDEAILALSNYQLADPISVFYRQRPAELSSHYGRASIILADPLALAEEVHADDEISSKVFATQVAADEVMEEAEAPAEAPSPEGIAGHETKPITVRTDFNPLAVFSPDVRTDSNGRAKVSVKLPDNLTRYRVMVVAVDNNNQFGSAESNIVARLPLMVRPSAPPLSKLW